MSVRDRVVENLLGRATGPAARPVHRAAERVGCLAHPGDRLRFQPRQPVDVHVRPRQPALRRPGGRGPARLHPERERLLQPLPGWPKYADLYGFALVFPQTSSANNANSCFNWYRSGDRGQGEALSIKQMVDYAKTQYGSDPSRVYVTGLSAGGAMTSVMLADYPDVFAGSSIDSGIPAGCATDLSSGLTCEYNPVSKTPQQWGDLVRSASGGWSGPWPRVAVWQGSGELTVNPANATESRDQWTNVRGMGETPSSTTTLTGGTTQDVYNDADGDADQERPSPSPA